MNTQGMNFDIKYISPVGVKEETHAEITITISIKQRADAQKFVLELKQLTKLNDGVLGRIKELKDWEQSDLGLTPSGKQSLNELERLYGESKK